MKDELTHEEISVQEYEVALLSEQNKELRTQIVQQKLHEEQQSKLYEAISKRLGIMVDKNNIDTIKLPRVVAGEIMDELYGNKDDLIRPSHQILKYSLIKKQPELDKCIPYQRPVSEIVSTLELLNERSSSRAGELLREYTASNTRRAYMGDLIYWQAWLSAAGFSFNESLTEKEIISFIVQHVEGLDEETDKKLVNQGYKHKLGPHKLATVKRRIISLSVFLELAKQPNP